MTTVKSSIWSVAPELGIPEPPALVTDSNELWLAYFGVGNEDVAVVRFGGVIDHRLSPINDEGLGKHPYARAGLQFYSFNELTGSEETKRWSVLNARHWVITFKDNTLDVIARTADVHAESLQFSSPLMALLTVLNAAQHL